VQTNSLVNLVISTSVARLRGYLAPTAVALANVTTEPRARVCGRPAATLEIKNIFADLAREWSSARVPRMAPQRPHWTVAVAGEFTGSTSLIDRLPQSAHTIWNRGCSSD